MKLTCRRSIIALSFLCLDTYFGTYFGTSSVAAQAVVPDKLLASSTLYHQRQSIQISNGSRVVVPKAWQTKSDQGFLELSLPNTNLKIALIEVHAENAETAIAAAWSRYKPEFSAQASKLNNLPDLNGWKSRVKATYVDSNSAQMRYQAQAQGIDDLWIVTLSLGSSELFTQREIDLGIINNSLTAPTFKAESLAGQIPNAIDQKRIAQIKAFFARGMQDLKIPGLAFALLDHGAIVYEGGMGVRQLGKPNLVDHRTRFMNGSTTKPITTMLMARLVDQGKFSWDQAVTQVYPPFQLSDPIATSKVTMRQLSCACTGVPNHQLSLFFGYGKVSPETLISRLAKEPLTTPFGEVYQYNNQMVAAAGYLSGHAAYPTLPLGPAFDKAIKEFLFRPLAMTDTTFDMSEAQIGNYALPHGIGADGETALTSMELNKAVRVFRPAGGAWTSIHDLALFLQFEANNGKLPNGRQLIRPESVIARRHPQVATGLDSFYGMGLGINQKLGITTLNHTGTVFGFNSILFLIPENGVGLVAMSNADQGVGLLTLARQRLLELIYDTTPKAELALTRLVEQNATTSQEQIKLTAHANRELENLLASKYTHPLLGTITVRKMGDDLHFDFGDWSTRVIGQKDDQGIVTFSSIDPSVGFIDYRIENREGKRSIVLELGDERYQFEELVSHD